ncbi:hypothetical protein KQX54_007240 [Cotesia glomerata]|uniref:Uncharacterized protein n=1 Tax=Cotesia glomerata TaxID=32391 RepID=A0AAV7HZG1_COTGL|nr:hypothetical protein KQX54_007240 [Cotesia glomerata]
MGVETHNILKVNEKYEGASLSVALTEFKSLTVGCILATLKTARGVCSVGLSNPSSHLANTTQTQTSTLKLLLAKPTLVRSISLH